MTLDFHRIGIRVSVFRAFSAFSAFRIFRASWV